MEGKAEREIEVVRDRYGGREREKERVCIRNRYGGRERWRIWCVKMCSL